MRGDMQLISLKPDKSLKPDLYGHESGHVKIRLSIYTEEWRKTKHCHIEPASEDDMEKYRIFVNIFSVIFINEYEMICKIGQESDGRGRYWDI